MNLFGQGLKKGQRSVNPLIEKVITTVFSALLELYFIQPYGTYFRLVLDAVLDQRGMLFVLDQGFGDY